MMHYVAWRAGRPRFTPSSREIALGFKGRDLRHASGTWFTREEAETFSRETYAAIVAARGEPSRATRVLREARQAGARQGYVYFLVAGAEIKIGFSTKPLARVGSLLTGMPREPTAFVAVRGSRSHERALHLKLARWRIHREWFEASPEVLAELFCALQMSEDAGDRR